MAQRGSKVNIVEYIKQSGVVFKEVSVSGETVLRIVIENAGASNTIEVRGKIYGQKDYILIDSVNGNGTKDFNVELYDYVLIDCTHYDSPINYLKVIASSFSNATVSAINGGTSSTVTWDEINTTFPSPVTELYTYKYKSNTVQTVLVTYDSTMKKTIVSLQKTRF
jgi:hypothetical protein